MSPALIELLIGIGGQIYKTISQAIETAKQNAELTEEQAAALRAKMDMAFKTDPAWIVKPDPQ